MERRRKKRNSTHNRIRSLWSLGIVLTVEKLSLLVPSSTSLLLAPAATEIFRQTSADCRYLNKEKRLLKENRPGYKPAHSATTMKPSILMETIWYSVLNNELKGMGFIWKVDSYTTDKWIPLFPFLLESFNNVFTQVSGLSVMPSKHIC
jgi:hypothetical protein